jgi:hypothetical protein
MEEYKYRSIHSQPRHKLEVGGQVHVPAALPLPFAWKYTRHLFNKRVGGQNRRFERFVEETTLLALPEIQQKFLDRPTYSFQNYINYLLKFLSRSYFPHRRPSNKSYATLHTGWENTVYTNTLSWFTLRPSPFFTLRSLDL